MERTFLHLFADFTYRRWRNNYDTVIPKIFGCNEMPLLDDVVKNVSLLMVNSHFTYRMPKTVALNVVEIGGVHIRSSKSLPKVCKCNCLFLIGR